MSDWTEIKQIVLGEFIKANVTDKVFIKKYLKLTRYINTCRNKLDRGESWGRVCYSEPYNNAIDVLNDLKLNHSEILYIFNEANGYLSADCDTDIGNMIC